VSEQLPLFPLGTVLFPGMILPMHVFEDRYRTMMQRRLGENPIFGVVLTRFGNEVGDEPDIFALGTAASLVNAVRYADERYDIVVRGGRRFRVLAGDWDEGYLTGTVEWVEPNALADSQIGAVRRLGEAVRDAFGQYLDALQRMTGASLERIDLGADAIAAAYGICAMMPFDLRQRQALLESVTAQELLHTLLEALQRERSLLLQTGIGGAPRGRPQSRFTAN
jgi:Lon protease-like protein